MCETAAVSMQKVEYILWDTSSLYTSSAMLILRNSCTLLVFLVAFALSLPQLVARHSTKNWVEDNKEPSNETIWQMWQMFSGRHFFIVRGFTKKFSHHCGRCLEVSAPELKDLRAKQKTRHSWPVISVSQKMSNLMIWILWYTVTGPRGKVYPLSPEAKANAQTSLYLKWDFRSLWVFESIKTDSWIEFITSTP